MSASIIIDVMCSKSEYFKEGKKASTYSSKSKSRWCPISPYQSLLIVSDHGDDHGGGVGGGTE